MLIFVYKLVDNIHKNFKIRNNPTKKINKRNLNKSRNSPQTQIRTYCQKNSVLGLRVRCVRFCRYKKVLVRFLHITCTMHMTFGMINKWSDIFALVVARWYVCYGFVSLSQKNIGKVWRHRLSRHLRTQLHLQHTQRNTERNQVTGLLGGEFLHHLFFRTTTCFWIEEMFTFKRRLKLC